MAPIDTLRQQPGRKPTPSWTRLRSEPRQRSERSSPGRGIRQKPQPPNRRAKPWRRGSHGAPRVGC
eukprot:9361490-Alexandrium_andersonii.AAC.1